MDRRNLLQGIAFLGGAQAALPILGQETTGRSVLRTSRIFEPISKTGRDLLQALLVTPEVTYSLHGDTFSRQWAVTAVDIHGTKLWSHSLPVGSYSGLGTIQNGRALVVHAFSMRDQGIARRNCLMHLDPNSGDMRILGLADAAGTTSRMWFAGDSYLIRIGKRTVEIWDVHSGVTLKGTATLATEIDAPGSHVDVIPPGIVTTTQHAGNSLVTVSIPDGTTKEILLSAPEILRSHEVLQQLGGSTPPVPSGAVRASSSTLAITGVSLALQKLLALVLPVRTGQPIPMISIDPAGTVSSVGSYPVSLRSGPLKILTAANEVGVVYADGSAAWYSI